MSSGKTDEDYYRAIEKLLGINKSALNHYLREQLQIESNKREFDVKLGLRPLVNSGFQAEAVKQ